MTVAAMQLHRVTNNHRALKAFIAAGITTVDEFLNTPKQTLLKVPGFGIRTYEAVLNKIESLQATPYKLPDLIPANLLDLPFETLHLTPELLEGFRTLGIHSLRGAICIDEDELLQTPGISQEGVNLLRAELSRVVQLGTDHVSATLPTEIRTFAALYEALTNTLTDVQRRIFDARVGIGKSPLRPDQLALRMKMAIDDLDELEASIHRTLRQNSAGILVRIRDEMRRELRAFDGVVTGKHLAPGTILHAAARESGDRDLPLRLAAFCAYDEFYHSGEILCDLPKSKFISLRKELRHLTQNSKLPITLDKVESDIRQLIGSVSRELVLHIIREQFHLSVYIDEQHGEVIAKRKDSVADRIQEILDEVDGPMHIDQVMFDYRDRHRRCSHSRLLDSLRTDNRFLKVDKGTWSLRVRHVDELEMSRVEAERMSSEILSSGGRKSVYALSEGNEITDRAACLIIDLLRRDRSLKDLGRGEFAPRNMANSTMVEELMDHLRCAMGELPISRFLQNQPENRRRLISTLLTKNRLFISPGKDRIDLLENYPYNPDRMRKLLIAVNAELEIQGGYTTLDRLHDAVEEVGMSGGWLTDHLLLDLLARHGDFEFLPGGIVAQASLGLIGWIQQRAREAIRAAHGHTLTTQQLLIEEPDLAAFHECLHELLERDPLIQSPDGMHYEVV